MLILRYLTRRLLGYFFSISVLLAFLFNFIEFFEKLMRVKHASVLTILRFLALRFLPSFFEMMPIGIWLATCLLLKELCQRHELELMQLVTFSQKRFFSFFLLTGLLLSTSVLIIRERLIIPLAFKSERFKEERLKQGNDRRLIGQWFELDQERFCYSSLIDLDTGQARDMLVFNLTPDFLLTELVAGHTATLDHQNSHITIMRGQRCNVAACSYDDAANMVVDAPSFFSQLAMHFKAPTLSSLIRKVFFLHKTIPPHVYSDILYECLNRIAFYLQLFLYPLVTYLLFSFTAHVRIRWALALLPYPLFTLLDVLASGLFRSGLSAVVALLPSLLVGLGVLFGRLFLFF